LIKSSYPGNAKVEKCIFHAPHVELKYPIAKVAELLTQSKVHYLPIFDENKQFKGIISARRILTVFQDYAIFHQRIEDYLKEKNRPVITIFENDSIAKALNVFKTTKVSKLIVVNKALRLRGIISYYDLISYLVSPKNAPRKGGIKNNFSQLLVKNFAKFYVITMDKNSYVNQALKLILEKKIGSVVIVDEQKHPIGIITTKDLLHFLIRNKVDNKLELQEKDLSPQNKVIVNNFFQRLSLSLQKIPDLTKAKLFIKEKKQGGIFEVILSLFPLKGKPQIIKKEGKNLTQVLKQIKRD